MNTLNIPRHPSAPMCAMRCNHANYEMDITDSRLKYLAENVKKVHLGDIKKRVVVVCKNQNVGMSVAQYIKAVYPYKKLLSDDNMRKFKMVYDTKEEASKVCNNINEAIVEYREANPEPEPKSPKIFQSTTTTTPTLTTETPTLTTETPTTTTTNLTTETTTETTTNNNTTLYVIAAAVVMVVIVMLKK